MRLVPTLLATAIAATPLAALAQDTTPVVLELFTSQGCSSCPPADALFEDMAAQPGVIALALHVDYWDYLGWKDAFGRPGNTARQKAYARAAHSRSIFTPEIVVQGVERMKGHDGAGILREIARVRQQPPGADLAVTREGDSVSIHLTPAASGAGPADVHLVAYRPSEEVAIEGGENAGQSVTYTNIVTDWQTIARWDGSAPLDMRYDGVPEGPVAVIVQGAHMGPILAAATAL